MNIVKLKYVFLKVLCNYELKTQKAKNYVEKKMTKIKS